MLRVCGRNGIWLVTEPLPLILNGSLPTSSFTTRLPSVILWYCAKRKERFGNISIHSSMSTSKISGYQGAFRYTKNFLASLHVKVVTYYNCTLLKICSNLSSSSRLMDYFWDSLVVPSCKVQSSNRS